MKKIMFNDKYELTNLVLNGKKTQFREIAKIQPPYQNSEIAFPTDFWEAKEPEKHRLFGAYCWINKESNSEHTDWIIPKYKKEEVVAVAQSYQDAGYKCYAYRDTDEFLYFMKDGEDIAIPPIAETNKMFVMAEFMPHQIKITNVRIQRLQEISEEDCLKEGIWKAVDIGFEGETYWYPHLANSQFRTPREAFAALIDKVNKKGTWERNPYVWIYDFELVK